MATILQKEVKKQLSRIRRAMRRAEKRGYVFTDAQKKRYEYTPKKASSKTLAQLKKVTGKKLRTEKGTEYGGSATQGEIVPGKEGYAAEKSQAKARELETKRRNAEPLNEYEIFDLVRETLQSIPDEMWIRPKGGKPRRVILSGQKNRFVEILDSKERTDENAQYLRWYYQTIQNYVFSVMQDSDDVTLESDLRAIINILRGMT